MAGLYNRSGIFYAKFYVAGTPKRVSLKIGDRRIVKTKRCEIEGALDRGSDSPLPTTGTPLEVTWRRRGYRCKR